MATFDIIIANGTIVDGTGRKRYLGDIGIKNNIIAKVGELKNDHAKEIIDANGKIVTPGFIDITNQSDSYLTILANKSLDSLIKQGITTALIGHYGSSLAPLGSNALNNPRNRFIDRFRSLMVSPPQSAYALRSIRRWVDITGININWVTLTDFRNEMEKRGMGVNLATLVGHSTLRRTTIGNEQRELSSEEREILKRLIGEALDEGAFGISFGLRFSHTRYIPTEELLDLASFVNSKNGKCYINIRNDRGDIVNAVKEAIEIAEATSSGVEITHLKTNSDTEIQFFEALKYIEDAHNRGININFDFYPYKYSWKVMYTLLPGWMIRGKREDMLGRLKNPELYEKVVKDLEKNAIDFSKITIAYAPHNKAFSGKNIAEMGRKRNIAPERAFLDAFIGVNAQALLFDERKSEKAVNAMARHPLSILSSGAGGYQSEYARDGQLVHPRSFGAFPHYLEKYVKEQKTIALENAIQKMTSIPALKIGITDRGFIDEGLKADIVVFDLKNIKDRSSMQNPFMYPQGIDHVIINGKHVLKDGNYSRETHGEFLTKAF